MIKPLGNLIFNTKSKNQQKWALNISKSILLVNDFQIKIQNHQNIKMFYYTHVLHCINTNTDKKYSEYKKK